MTQAQTAEELELIVNDAIQHGRFDAAIAQSQELTKIDPGNAFAWFLLGRATRLHGNLKKASAFLEKAVSLDSNNKQSLLELAYCYFGRGQSAKSLELLDRIEISVTGDAITSARLALLYNQLGEHSKPLALFQNAIIKEPNTARLHFGLAETLRFNGDFAKAEVEYNAAIQCDEHCYEAYYELANVRTHTRETNHTRKIETLLNSGVRSKRGAAKLLYALAKEYEDFGENKRAFINMVRAGELLAQINKYDVKTDVSLFKEMTDTYTKGYVDSNIIAEGFESEAPIFIVGMPRTGTTLVERILGSHSEIYPGGEHLALITQLHELIPEAENASNGSVFLSKSLIRQTTRIDHKKLGEKYIEQVQGRTQGHAYITDKLPINFYYIGLIRQALPKAKIIHLTRNPMDTCISNFKQYFTEGAYLFSYNLEDLSAYYLAYRRLMDHWHNVCPDMILDVSYEDLVHDIEGESRRILNYCGLDFEPECLRFHENKTPTTSRSARQVRESIYASSLSGWKRYEKYVQPLIDHFRANGIPIN